MINSYLIQDFSRFSEADS